MSKMATQVDNIKKYQSKDFSKEQYMNEFGKKFSTKTDLINTLKEYASLSGDQALIPASFYQHKWSNGRFVERVLDEKTKKIKEPGSLLNEMYHLTEKKDATGTLVTKFISLAIYQPVLLQSLIELAAHLYKNPDERDLSTTTTVSEVNTTSELFKVDELVSKFQNNAHLKEYQQKYGVAVPQRGPNGMYEMKFDGRKSAVAVAGQRRVTEPIVLSSEILHLKNQLKQAFQEHEQSTMDLQKCIESSVKDPELKTKVMTCFQTHMIIYGDVAHKANQLSKTLAQELSQQLNPMTMMKDEGESSEEYENEEKKQSTSIKTE